MSRIHVPGTCCSDMAPLVNSFTFATPIWAYFVPVKMSQKVQLVEVHGTRRGDKTLQRWHKTSCVRLVIRVAATESKVQPIRDNDQNYLCSCTEKTRWQPSVDLLFAFFMYLITELFKLCHPNLIAARFLGGCTFTNRANKGVIASLGFCPLAFFKLLVP